MAAISTQFMVPGGLGDVEAAELAAQINGKANADLLCRVCRFPDYLAAEVGRSIESGYVSTSKLRELGMAPALAEAILKAVVDKIRS